MACTARVVEHAYLVFQQFRHLLSAQQNGANESNESKDEETNSKRTGPLRRGMDRFCETSLLLQPRRLLDDEVHMIRKFSHMSSQKNDSDNAGWI